MTNAILSFTDATQTNSNSNLEVCSPHEVFFCPEESQFYSQCLEKMVFNGCQTAETIIEFGAGDGSPVINCLLKIPFRGMVHGYELSRPACEVANSKIQQYQLHHHYAVHNQCFFEGLKSIKAPCLIANPPYLPAPDDGICMPSLHGGIDGASITKQLLSIECEQVLLMISAYSSPIETVEYALDQGYQVIDFMVTPLRFGYYSCEPKVKDWIMQLRRKYKAFYSSNIYFLAGVLFQKRQQSKADLSIEFLKVMTAL
jgi:methylase of polypeptide subunit release factors